MMRITTLCFSATVGGLELGLLRAAAAMVARGHRASAILPNGTALEHHADALGLPHHTITPSRRYLDFKAARALRAVLAAEQTDLLLVGRTHDLSTALLAAGKDVTVVLFQQMQSGVNKRDWVHNRIYRRLDGCITLTRRGAGEMAQHTVLAPEKITVVPPGVDAARYAPGAARREHARRTFGIAPDAFTVGMVGGFNPGKGHREFLQALGIAVRMAPELVGSLNAILVGRRPGDSGEYVAELEGLRAELPIADRVALHPFADDPATAFAALDVFVLASYSETFGMVVQEAMASGVAVIATDAGGVPEIVANGATGVLVPPHNAEAIAQAIVELWRNPARREALAANARAFAVEAYDPTRQFGRFEQALLEAHARRCERQH